MQALIPLVPALPLIGFIINGLLGKKMSKNLVGLIGTGAVAVSFLISVGLFVQLLGDADLVFNLKLFTWLSVGGLNVNFAFLVDRLSVWMMLIITGVGTLIHIYSIGYMHDDEGFHKFFAYLNLFVFSMLLLVMGDNFLILFFGWEGVGLCSYLLIGFWYTHTSYGDAARKAFIMNRIGDLGLLLGMFLIFQHYGSLNYADVFGKAGLVNSGVITSITLLLFVGAMGKSAQIPLYTWLPDAMAGPTPVSALIHAATMVTAGIYMIVRANALFDLAPFTMEFITAIGLATSLFAALIGLKQNDIKKVLAYSTVSQLGLMFVAAGVGAYNSAMFHLTTHAFFKALLFLGAGSVIHAMGGDQDIRNYGGLKDKIKTTFLTFTIGTLAIIGMPPFSGFFSKDEMLAAAFAHSPILWALTVVSAGLTAIYMLRMYFLTFFGNFRGTEEQGHHLHESPSVMTLPLVVLAVLAALAGFMNLPAFTHLQWFNHYLTPIMPIPPHEMGIGTESALMAVTLAMVFAILYWAKRYFAKAENVPVPDEKQAGFEKMAAHKFYVDELYNAIFVRPIETLSTIFYQIVDTQVIDGIVNSVGKAVDLVSGLVRRVQTGNIEAYLFYMVAGIILILLMSFWG